MHFKQLPQLKLFQCARYFKKRTKNEMTENSQCHNYCELVLYTSVPTPQVVGTLVLHSLKHFCNSLRLGKDYSTFCSKKERKKKKRLLMKKRDYAGVGGQGSTDMATGSALDEALLLDSSLLISLSDMVLA